MELIKWYQLRRLEKLFGELPKDVKEDPYYRKEFILIVDGLIHEHGAQWVKDHRVMLLSQWEYVRTLEYGRLKMITVDQARELLGDFVEDDDEPS